MMTPSLTDRLRGIVKPAVPRVAPEALLDTGRASARRGSLDAAGRERAAAMLGGSVIDRPEGPVIVVDRHHVADALHGRIRVGDVARILSGGASALDVLGRAWPSARFSDPPAPSLLFLDLETTGLAGGAGTRAFLAGCARVGADSLTTRQFLLPGDDHEPALLKALTHWVGSGDALVTFNGRTFDLPLIETRYLFHRLAFPLEDVPHIDMLHPARRLWKLRPAPAGPMPDEGRCSLSTLEKRLAGLHRIGDVAGFEIPSRYFQFLRDGDARPLEAVLEHNRLDLISTALLMARTLALIERGPAAASDPHECLGLGRLYDRAGALENAEAAYLCAVDMAGRVGCEPDLHGDALRRLAYCRRRTGRLAEAAEAWQALATLPGCPARLRCEAQEALAIHHEHRLRDLTTARALVRDLLDDDLAARKRADAEYRLRRLERKLTAARRTEDPPLPLA